MKWNYVVVLISFIYLLHFDIRFYFILNIIVKKGKMKIWVPNQIL